MVIIDRFNLSLEEILQRAGISLQKAESQVKLTKQVSGYVGETPEERNPTCSTCKWSRNEATICAVHVEGENKIHPEGCCDLWNVQNILERYNEWKNTTLEDGVLRVASEPLQKAEEDIYSFIDNQLQKAGLSIEGDHPRGAKTVGRTIETHLYKTMHEAIQEYLNSLTGNESQTEVLNQIDSIIQQWVGDNAGAVREAFDALFSKGLAAGAASAGAAAAVREGKLGTNDQLALDIIRDGKYRIGERIKTFGDEAVEKFSKVIHDAYTPEGTFFLDSLVEKMGDAVPAQRSHLELIARTETSQVSNVGRLWGWEQAPNKYHWKYYWQHKDDERTKPISRLRASYNPLTFDEAKFLWLHQEQRMPNGKFQNDSFNQRCTLSREPSGEEFKGNRFDGQEQDFRQTFNISF